MNKTLSLRLAGLFVLSLAFSSCSKQGPAGATGTTGATGATGPAGANGSQIYSGNGAPAPTLGTTGDYYLDLSTGNLYGPKTTGGWGTPLVLKGATGATGADGAAGTSGSQIYSGTTVPGSSLGNAGDYYLDQTTYMLYGPKTSTGWGVPILLQGPQGPQGPMGNANVKEETFSLVNAQWASASYYSFDYVNGLSIGVSTRYYDAAFPALTQGILDSGMVLAYFTPSPSTNADQWVPLPYSFLDFSGDFTYNVAYETNIGTVRLHFFFNLINQSATLPNLYSYAIATYQFKLVVVSGTLAGTMQQRGIDTGDYNAVSKFLSGAGH